LSQGRSRAVRCEVTASCTPVNGTSYLAPEPVNKLSAADRAAVL